MRLVQARFITACQQLLALGVVLAVLTPASGVVSLDIVGQHPGAAGAGGPAVISGALRSATVPTAVVEPTVTEVPLTTASGSARSLAGRTVVGASVTSSRVTSKPQDVTGYGAVGVTWAHGEDLDDDQIALQVRTRQGDAWSDWADLEYHDDHAPDADSPDAATSRPGTDPLIIGDVDAVQIKARAGDALPDDLSMAVVEPGRARRDRDRGAGRRRHGVRRRVRGAQRRDRGDHRGRHRAPGRPQGGPADHLLARPVGGRRVDPQQELAALRLHQRRLRAPHRQRQQLHRGAGAGASSAASTPTT